jgi:predicted permease
MDSVYDDCRLAVRLLWKDRTFSLAAVLTLSLCIAANVALFAVVDHVLLNPLPYGDPDRIVYMHNTYPKAGIPTSPFRAASASVPDYYDRLREIEALESQAMFTFRNLSVGKVGQAERVLSMSVTPAFFRVLQVDPYIGRGFLDEEGEIGHEQRVVLSYGAWQRLVGGDPRVIGTDLRIDDKPHTIVGIMPLSFEFVDPDVGVWIPAAFTAAQRSDDFRHSNVYGYIGRLKAGATIEQVQSQVDALNTANKGRFPDYADLVATGFRTNVGSWHGEVVRSVRSTLALLWGATWCVLLIGFVNVVNLGLLRFRQRTKEFAARAMLGATRWRLVRLLLTENLLLAVAAASVGLIAGGIALHLFNDLHLTTLPRSFEIRLDGMVIAYTLGIVMLMAIALGTIPVFGMIPRHISEALREEGRSGTASRQGRSLRRALVVAEIAFAFVLLIGAGLFIASYREVLRLDPGFRSQGVMTMGMLLPPFHYPDAPAIRRGVDDAVRRIRTVPGVTSVGATTWIPFGTLGRNQWTVVPGGFTFDSDRFPTFSNRVLATPGLLEAMGARLMSGRLFEDRDIMSAQRVTIVDERLAKRLWPGVDPIGRRLFHSVNDAKKGSNDRLVVGVVSNIKLAGLDESRDGLGTFFVPYAQLPDGQIWRIPFFAVKGTGDLLALAAPVRAALSAFDRDAPVFDLTTMDERTERSLGARRAGLLVLIGLSAVGIVLAAVGIYGVVAYWVRVRAKEFGIRIALGSSIGTVVALVAKEGLALAGTGVMLGIVSALSMGQLVRSHLFDVEPTSPAIFGVVTLAVIVVASCACIVPARRAGRVDPARILVE